MTEHEQINLLVVVFHPYERIFLTFDLLDFSQLHDFTTHAN